MVQQSKVLATTTKEPSSIPMTHKVEVSQSSQIVLCPPKMDAPPHTWMWTKTESPQQQQNHNQPKGQYKVFFAFLRQSSLLSASD